MGVEPQNLASVKKPWAKYFPEGVMQKPLPQCTLYERLESRIEERNAANKTALHYFGTKISYGELLTHIKEYAAAFSEYGIKKGDYVSLLTVNTPETIYALYGLNYLGAVLNLIDPQTDIHHVKEFVNNAKSTKMIVIDALWDNISEVKDDLDLIIVQSPFDSLNGVIRTIAKLKAKTPNIPFDGKRVIHNRDFASKGIGKTVERVKYEKDMPAAITKTGGTTGLPKGVILTNDSINAIVSNIIEFGIDYSVNERELNIVPVGFSFGLVIGLHMPLCMCFDNILIPKFEAEKFADLVVKYKPNHIIGAPIHYETFLNNKKMQKMDLSFLHNMAAGGDTMNVELEKKFQNFCDAHKVPYPLAVGYGMSEVSSAATFGVQNVHKPGSCGIPCIYTTIGVFEPGTDKELPIGEAGEICISGPTLMKGYLNRPEETENVMRMHSDGIKWIHSEDLGYIDEDGFVFITGRMKRSVVRFDGFKVYPLQIEEAIMKHKDLYNCCVVPTRDVSKPQGELPLAYVELSPDNTKDKDTIKKEIYELLDEHLDLRSRPCDIIFIDKIPVSVTGKNDYRALMDRQ